RRRERPRLRPRLERLEGRALLTAVTASLTADNHYVLYYGPTDGSRLSFVGRNERGPNGNPGEFNWSSPETYDFNLGPGDRIYVVAWNELSADPSFLNPKMLIGQFQIGGTTFTTNAAQWEDALGGLNPGSFGDPSPEDVGRHIVAASWEPPGASLPDGTRP